MSLVLHTRAHNERGALSRGQCLFLAEQVINLSLITAPSERRTKRPSFEAARIGPQLISRSTKAAGQ